MLPLATVDQHVGTRDHARRHSEHLVDGLMATTDALHGRVYQGDCRGTRDMNDGDFPVNVKRLGRSFYLQLQLANHALGDGQTKIIRRHEQEMTGPGGL